MLLGANITGFQLANNRTGSGIKTSFDNFTGESVYNNFDLQGNLVAKNRVTLQAYISPQPGWAEQDPEYFWQKLALACQGLWAQEGGQALRERIAGVALTTQRSTVINVDDKGLPLRPAIVWLDQRRTPGLKPLGGPWGLAFLVSGMTQTVAYLQAEAEANWLYTYQPEVWRKTWLTSLLRVVSEAAGTMASPSPMASTNRRRRSMKVARSSFVMPPS